MKRELGVGYCGLICALCDENEDCVGCKKGGCPQKDNCKNYQCCTTKNFHSCYQCTRFACQDSILHKQRIMFFCELIEEYGEKQILDCMERNENNGIVYHYSDSHLGDYDMCKSKEELRDLVICGK